MRDDVHIWIYIFLFEIGINYEAKRCACTVVTSYPYFKPIFHLFFVVLYATCQMHAHIHVYYMLYTHTYTHKSIYRILFWEMLCKIKNIDHFHFPFQFKYILFSKKPCTYTVQYTHSSIGRTMNGFSIYKLWYIMLFYNLHGW